MHRQGGAVLVAALVVAGTSLSAAAPASAATDTLYVNRNTAQCSDSGPGSQSQPYCTIAAAAAAAQPGQTVLITGSYSEQVVLSRSGTPGAPITFQNNGAASVSGPQAGLDITGQHDLVIDGITFDHSNGISISGASDITLSRNTVSSSNATGIALDATTHDVRVRSNVVVENDGGIASKDGIRIAGTGNLVADNLLHGNGSEETGGNAGGIDIVPTAVDTVVADNYVSYSRYDGILVSGTGTDVVNNTLVSNCLDGIDVADGASGTVVENNIAWKDSGGGGGACNLAPLPSVDIGVYGAATSSTRVDYNLTYPAGTNPPYAWNTPQATLAAFQTASGQGAHDIEADPLTVDAPCYLSPAVDSADSGAPGVQSTDLHGASPVDDPYSPTTGVGPVAYLDRGAVELVPGPPSGGAGVTSTVLTPMPSPSWSVTASADTSVGWAPIVGYTFNFGDGSATVTQSTSKATHRYAQPGSYTLTNTETDADGHVATTTQTVWLAPPTAALTVTPASGHLTVTADASWSTSGSANGLTFRYAFGDGTTLDDAPTIVSHAYAHTGRYTVTVTVTDSSGLTVSASQTVMVADGAYTPLGPVRLLDTRAAIGVPTTTAVQPGHTVSLTVAGAGGVPASGVTAVALTVTVTQPSSSGVLTVYPDGQARPLASNLNWVAGQTVPNLVIVPVTNGKVDFFNSSSGTVHLIADLAGYFSHDTSASTYSPVRPVRLLDTRAAIGVPTTTAVQPGHTVSLTVAGAGGVPASGVTAVALTVTVTQPSSSGVLTVYPDGQARPLASNLNWVAGQTVPNLVVVPVINGKVDFFNSSSGTVHLIADLAGYFSHDTSASSYSPLGPLRVLDTRAAIGVPSTGPLPPGGGLLLQVDGWLPVSGVKAVVLNVTVTQPSSSGVLTVYPDGQARPLASNLNWVAGQTVANLVVVPVINGKVDFFNSSSGTVHVIADLAGYFT